jgi:hypothetical protein
MLALSASIVSDKTEASALSSRLINGDAAGGSGSLRPKPKYRRVIR